MAAMIFMGCAEAKTSTIPGGDNKPQPGDHHQTDPQNDTQIELPEDQSTWTAEDWARARISHIVSTEEAFYHISSTTGFPIETSNNSILFMHWYDNGNWAVSGDFNEWGSQAMTRDGDMVYIEIEKPDNSDNLYKFIHTDTNEYIADPWAMHYNYDENGEISYIHAPQNTAYMMRWKRVKSPQGLKDRTVRAWIPATQPPYKVLYAHDGQNLFPDSGNGGWKLRQNLDDIHANFIVVGIDNTEDRMQEYIHTDDRFFDTTYSAKGDLYADFVENTVRPMIESHFRTTKIAGQMGSSLGGLISLYIAHLYPERYQVVLALSPTTAWGDFELHNETIQDIYTRDGFKSNRILYLDNGGNEGSGCKFTAEDAKEDEDYRDNYCYTRAFVDKMAEIGYTFDVNLFHWFELNAAHNEDAWAARVSRPLMIFMEKI